MPQANETPRSSRAGGRRGMLPSPKFAPISVERVPAFVDLLKDAYPLFVEDRERTIEVIRRVLAGGYPQILVASERGGRVIGGYARYTFVATIGGRGIPASGLGMVATALDRKRQKVALAIVRDFVLRTRRERHPLSLLYPFRHDFYAEMGWASVAEARHHRISPSSLPLFAERQSVRLVRDPDWRVLDRIHRQAVGRRQGLGLSRHPSRWDGLLRRNPQVYLVDGKKEPEGYLLALFARRAAEPDGFRYDLEVLEMDWLTSEAMRALLGLLSSQRDQVVDLVFDWPPDEHLDAILREPAPRGALHLSTGMVPGPIIGMGAMLRLEDPAEAFRLRPYRGDGTLLLEVRTDEPLAGQGTVRFEALLRGGDAPETPESRPPRARLAAGRGTLARLWAGSLTLREAICFSLARITPDSAAERLEKLLSVRPPWIVERF